MDDIEQIAQVQKFSNLQLYHQKSQSYLSIFILCQFKILKEHLKISVNWKNQPLLCFLYVIRICDFK